MKFIEKCAQMAAISGLGDVDSGEEIWFGVG